MEQCSEVFIGIDVAKMRNAIAVADGERGGEVRGLLSTGSLVLPHFVWRGTQDQVAVRARWRNSAKPARPNIVRLSIFSLPICPSTGLVDHPSRIERAEVPAQRCECHVRELPDRPQWMIGPDPSLQVRIGEQRPRTLIRTPHPPSPSAFRKDRIMPRSAKPQTSSTAC